MSTRRGVILPVVLFVLVLLGLFGAMFSFRIHADVSQVQAVANRLQTRLAAEAGIEAVKLLLRTARSDRTQWHHNPDAFHRVMIWANGEDSRVSGTNEELDEKMVYRFSIVADDPLDDEKYMRFGITDEASKLNLNSATEEQLLSLLEQVIAGAEGGEEIDPQTIVDAIIDWRDTDTTPNGDPADTEGDYYLALDKPYGVKNGNFSSIEELLLVKGVTGSILYGEDFDRNGLLTPNEDDGDQSFPPDNQDGVLTRGLFPYLTVLAYENDVSNDNRQRVFLFSDEATLKKDLQQVFPDDQEVVDFIVAATRVGPGTGGSGGKKPTGQAGPKSPKQPTGLGGGPQSASPEAGPTKDPAKPGGKPPTTPPANPPKPGGKNTPSGKAQQQPPAGSTDKPSGGAQTPPRGGQPGGQQAGQPRRQTGAQPPAGGTQADPKQPTSGTQADPKQPTGGTTGGTEADEENSQADEGGEEDGKEQTEDGTGTAGGDDRSIRSPASLLRPRRVGETDIESPLAVEDLPILMDRLTTRRPEKNKVTRVEGLININTAPREVLRCLPGLTGEQIEAIVTARESLDAETLATPAWLMTEGILELDAFDAIASSITSRSQQFTIESLGYADHMGMVTRLQVVVDMVGPIAQTIYYRDLSYLGGSYPIREEDREQVRGR